MNGLGSKGTRLDQLEGLNHSNIFYYIPLVAEIWELWSLKKMMYAGVLEMAQKVIEGGIVT